MQQSEREAEPPVASGSQPRVEVTSSLARGKHPPQGIQSPPFVWSNLLDGPPPRRKTRGEGAHATYQGSEVGEDTRIAYSTIVSVDPGFDLDSPDDDIIMVDVRVNVQRRALQELIDRERAFSDQFAAQSRAKLAHRLVKQRAAANALKAKWALATAIKVIRFQAKLGYWRIATTRKIMRGAVRVPDLLVTKSQTAVTHLGNKYGRRTMISGLKDPSILNNEQKGVVFFVSIAILVATILLLSNVFALALPQGAPIYTRMLADGTASLLSILALPIPNEPILIATTIALGPIVAFFGSFVGKMIGVWLLFFLGDSLFDTITKATASKPRLRKLVDWMSLNSNKYGFPILIAVNTIPFVPDVLLYVFAVSGMKYKPYMSAIAIGTTIKFGLIVASVVLIGPDRVLEFFTSPFG